MLKFNDVFLVVPFAVQPVAHRMFFLSIPPNVFVQAAGGAADNCSSSWVCVCACVRAWVCVCVCVCVCFASLCTALLSSKWVACICKLPVVLVMAVKSCERVLFLACLYINSRTLTPRFRIHVHWVCLRVCLYERSCDAVERQGRSASCVCVCVSFSVLITACLPRTCRNGWTRVIVEKPFGRDSESSAELGRGLSRHLTEEQVCVCVCVWCVCVCACMCVCMCVCEGGWKVRYWCDTGCVCVFVCVCVCVCVVWVLVWRGGCVGL